MPLSRSGKPYYTKEQMDEAKMCSALEYARTRHYDLVPNGVGRYYLREHDSMIFMADGRWYWNSRQQKGRALDFMLFYEGRTMLEAVLTLTNDPAFMGSSGPVSYRAVPEPPTPPKVFTLPDRADTSRQLFAYLCKTRGLDREILLDLIHEKRLYQSQFKLNEKTIYNAVFVGLDDHGTPRNAFQRGITAKSTFKHSVEGSDKGWPFIIPGSSAADTLAIFEGAIDAISHATMAKAEGGDWKQITRMAVGGNFPIIAVTRYLDAHPGIKNLVISFDADKAGRNMVDYLASGITDRQIGTRQLLPPQGKDWNEYLTEYYMEGG